MRNTRGYTLVELMITVAIIGILAAIATPKFSNTIRQSQESRTKMNLAGIRSAIGLYYTDLEGRPPIDSLQSLIPKYIQAIPQKFTPTYHPEGNTVSAGPLIAMDDATGDWFYINDPNDGGFGHVFVNCVHMDMKGNSWTSY